MKFRSLASSFSLRRIFQLFRAASKPSEISRLRAESARYKGFLDAAPIGHFTLDSGFRIVESNPVGAQRLGASASDLHLSAFLTHVISTDRIRVSNTLSDLIATRDKSVITLSTSLHAHTGVVPVMLHLSLANPCSEHDIHCHIAMVDLSEHQATQNNLRIARDGLHHIANHDHLTRLPNRYRLIEHLQLAVSKSNNLALLLLDLDHFKQINDPLGHHVGDMLLREVAERLLNTVSKLDTVGRLGGDDFGIILRDVSDVSEICRIAEKINQSLALPYTSTPHDIRLSASIGISLAPANTTSARQLLYFADAAMNRAKQRGRNCIQFYTSAINTSLTERFELERDLQIAIKESQFELYYQPQYDLRSRSINCYEVLLRWNHPQRGIIGPDTFIQVLEDTGLIEPLGEWILLEACQKLVELRKTSKDIKFSVNVSAKQFARGNLHKRIAEIIETTGVPANAIELELTESALFENADHSIKILDNLRDAGVEFAIDDFGTGYSSFSRLQTLPVTKVKIDRSFVHDIPANQSNCAIAKAIISVAHNLGLQVVAEGVETSQQLKFLVSANCDVLQGFHIGRPCTFKQLKDKLSQQSDIQDFETA